MTETFAVSLAQARAYEDYFVPALFAQWVPWVVDAADVRPGHRVLDVGCGTGVVARAAADRVGVRGEVTGLDLNPAMIEVAAAQRPDVTWRQGDAQDLPFPEGSFDAVLCQSALMFVPDVARALREMRRVSRSGGRVVTQTYAHLDDQPGYGPFVDVVVKHAGHQARRLLSTYWSLGDSRDLSARFESAGLDTVTTETRLGVARFGSVAELVRVEIGGTPLADRVGEDRFHAIAADASAVLERYIGPGGDLNLPIRAVLTTGRRP